MTALVVYESMFGNTRDVAEAIGRGLEEGGVGSLLAEVGHAPDTITEDHELVIAGGPTHAFGLSRSSTREDAARQAGTPLVSAGRGLREWLDVAESSGRLLFATFDTKVDHPYLPGSAASAAAKQLRHKRWIEVADPRTFYVDHVKGPLLEGELARAEQWGTAVAAATLRRLVS